VEQHRVVAEWRVDALADVDAGDGREPAEVAGPEVAPRAGAGRPVGVERADHAAVGETQVAVPAGVLARRRVGQVDPLVRAGLAPEPHVAAGVRGGHDLVVAELVPGVASAAQLRLARARVAIGVELVAVGGQAEPVDEPAPEDAAALGGADVDAGALGGERCRARGERGRRERRDGENGQERASGDAAAIGIHSSIQT
jgi:hypothetical protein